MLKGGYGGVSAIPGHTSTDHWNQTNAACAAMRSGGMDRVGDHSG